MLIQVSTAIRTERLGDLLMGMRLQIIIDRGPVVIITADIPTATAFGQELLEMLDLPRSLTQVLRYLPHLQQGRYLLAKRGQDLFLLLVKLPGLGV